MTSEHLLKKHVKGKYRRKNCLASFEKNGEGAGWKACLEKRCSEASKTKVRGIRGWNLERDPFLFETNVPGVFAAGDVRSGANRRVAAAVGEGSAAIYTVHKYLETV